MKMIPRNMKGKGKIMVQEYRDVLSSFTMIIQFGNLRFSKEGQKGGDKLIGQSLTLAKKIKFGPWRNAIISEYQILS